MLLVGRSPPLPLLLSECERRALLVKGPPPFPSLLPVEEAPLLLLLALHGGYMMSIRGTSPLSPAVCKQEVHTVGRGVLLPPPPSGCMPEARSDGWGVTPFPPSGYTQVERAVCQTLLSSMAQYLYQSSDPHTSGGLSRILTACTMIGSVSDVAGGVCRLSAYLLLFVYVSNLL